MKYFLLVSIFLSVSSTRVSANVRLNKDSRASILKKQHTMQAFCSADTNKAAIKCSGSIVDDKYTNKNVVVPKDDILLIVPVPVLIGDKTTFVQRITTKSGQLQKIKNFNGLIVLNGKIINHEQIKKLDFEKKKSWSIKDLGPLAATNIYGKIGKHGAIALTIGE
jgi:hypothetical protein